MNSEEKVHRSTGIMRCPTRAQVLTTLALAALVASTLVVPDHLASALGMRVRSLYDATSYLAFGVVAMLLMLVRARSVVLGSLLVLALLETLHFCYLGYFGGVIDANAIEFGLSETTDVAQAALGISAHFFIVPLLVLLMYGCTIYVVGRFERRRWTVPRLWLGWLLLVGFGPVKVLTAEDPVRYLPIDYYPSVGNSYLTLSTLVARQLTRLVPASAAQHSSPHQAVQIGDTARPAKLTIVLIMSESLTSNHMSLFGYERDTTPRLHRLSADQNFHYVEGIAGGVGTISSLHSFWNGVRDPRDRDLYETQAANLFRLARLHDFHTALVSAQGNNLLRGDGTRFIDVLVTDDIDPDGFQHDQDDRLLEYARNLELQDRNFLVFHQRSVHAPYEHNYVRHPQLAAFPTEGLGYETYQRNAYDNAVRYNDWLISELLEITRQRVAGPLIVVVTSDHGQLLGEHGLFGHGRLVPEIAEVPMLFYVRAVDSDVNRMIRALEWPTHAELSALISHWLGFDVVDGPVQDDVYYINGTARYGAHGYIKVIKHDDTDQPPEFEIVPTG